ncbi:MAG TPA: SMP-30/gluconolactonase/LRE family protein [Streptosporangiaceae bacterium]|nr:SMP-30/gluconolactonase/LRE family protein [Streptosporangiaceae bacterium]
MAQAELIPGTQCYHGEGPCWSDDWGDRGGGGLRWVDMLAGDVLALDAGGGVTRTHVGEVAAVIRPRAAGGAVLALQDRFVVTDGDLGQLRTVAEVPLKPGVRLNEGGCDPDGRFYCGSMASDESPQAGTFYRLDPDGSVHPVMDKVTISNGFDFSPDGGTAYYVDTAEQSIDVFDYSAGPSPGGGLANRRRWVEVPDDAGRPDGLTVDAEGGVWLALMEGGAVHRYAPSGALDAVIELPVSQVTACTFGGPGLGTLYITTSQIGADTGAQPDSGALFAVQPGVRGRPALTFAS